MKNSSSVLYIYTRAEFEKADLLMYGQIRRFGGGGGEVLVQFLDFMIRH